jgi:hypothetical protein
MNRKISRKQNPQLRNIALIAIAIAATIGIAAFLIIFTDTDTTVTLVNNGQCPRAALVLTSPDAGQITLAAGPGERDEADVVPGVDYEFTLTTETEDPDEMGMVCFDRDTGTFRPERGSNTDFVVESDQRPFIVFEIDEECPPATITLASQRDDRRDPLELNSGESETVEINPGQVYTYSITLVDLATEEVCSEVEDATITLNFNESDTVRIAPTTSEE